MPTSAQNALAVFWAAVTVGRLAIALVSNRVRSTSIYVVLPWAIAVALLSWRRWPTARLPG